MSLLRGARRALDAVFAVAAALGDLAVAALALVMFVEIVLREGFNMSLRAADEMSGYLLVAATFFGLSAAIRRGALFRFDNICAALPPAFARVWERILYLLALGVGVIAFWRLYIYVERNFQRGAISEGYYEIPMWLVQLAMPLGLAVMILAILERLVTPFESEPE